MSCRDYLLLDKRSSTKTLVDSYAQGYVSGFNAVVHAQSKTDFLRAAPSDEVILYLSWFCEQNGGRTILNASNDYIAYRGKSMIQR